jgi:hypothetical protein
MSITTSSARAASRAKRHGANTAPVNFDPATHPIIARHWFGVEPLRPIGQIAAEAVADLRRRRHVQKVHRRGDRVLGEFLAELGAEFSIQTPIDKKLDTYAEIESEALETAGGDEFWQPPLYEVER